MKLLGEMTLRILPVLYFFAFRLEAPWLLPPFLWFALGASLFYESRCGV